MERKRAKAVLAMLAKGVTESKLHVLYQEVYGADFGGTVTAERAKQSIIEALTE
jgi:hypothetical protein